METLQLVHILPVVVSQNELIVSWCKRSRLPGEPAAAPVSLERVKDDRYRINLFSLPGIWTYESLTTRSNAELIPSIVAVELYSVSKSSTLWYYYNLNNCFPKCVDGLQLQKKLNKILVSKLKLRPLF